MKKIIILASVLLLAGAGCGKSENNAATNQQSNEPVVQEHIIESNITDEELAEFKNLFGQKDAELGFKSYYPTFIPEEIDLNKASLLVSDIENLGKVFTYSLGDVSNTGSAWVSFQEQKVDPEEGKYVIAAGETKLVYLDGYTVTNENSAGKFHHLVFTTKDGVLVKLTSQKFDTEALTKIAEAMK